MLTDELHGKLIAALSERNIRLRAIENAVKRLYANDKLISLCREAVAWQERVDEIKTEINK